MRRGFANGIPEPQPPASRRPGKMPGRDEGREPPPGIVRQAHVAPTR
ncbi:hypothetical protein Salmuc_00661 [Salipiger mucosus DSM 16094]|uniref:Uncharacterized protein n=1 Tax=Salipiger mucosus DSM 16094 TaxID=1123237 RepID=S9QZG8_9RHOB|nr:hypothetical protein Salmuc_00661 [Salipiger mucosus DSM 16094]